MRHASLTKTTALALALGLMPGITHADDNHRNGRKEAIQVGVRPYYLIEQMKDGPLKDKLKSCENGPFRRTEFSIGHRGGGTLQFPEHTAQSHQAGARMGAGILECDVTFTKDGQLVCRHDQCDLHATTNILATPLADKCSKPFTPAEFDADGKRTADASALCCTSDLTVEEFKSLKGKMEGGNPAAKTAKEYLNGTPAYRTDLYSTGGKLLTHKESIELIRKLGAKFTPELKAPNRDAKVQLEDVFGSAGGFAQALVDEYKAAGVPAKNVWVQSFTKDDVLWLIDNEPDFGKQAVYLDDAEAVEDLPSADELEAYYEAGIRIVAPPTFALLTVEDGKIVPSQYAKDVKAAGLGIITWTLERSGRIVEDVLPTKDTDSPSFYYLSTLDALQNDGDIFTTLDVLAQQVGIQGIFSDWSGTVSYYASCFDLH